MSHAEVAQDLNLSAHENQNVDLLVMSDFLDVFLKEVPDLPPLREMKFSIDPVSGARPVFIAPYQVVLAELTELKKQIEKFLKKQFIRAELV